jgi:hypothetical protein
VGLTGLLLYWLPARLSPGIQNSPALAYLLYLAASVVGFGLWPRVWMIVTHKPSDNPSAVPAPGVETPG